MSSSEAEAISRRVVGAFRANDLDALRTMLAEDVASYLTNADGGVDQLRR